MKLVDLEGKLQVSHPHVAQQLASFAAEKRGANPNFANPSNSFPQGMNTFQQGQMPPPTQGMPMMQHPMQQNNMYNQPINNTMPPPMNPHMGMPLNQPITQTMPPAQQMEFAKTQP